MYKDGGKGRRAKRERGVGGVGIFRRQQEHLGMIQWSTIF